MKNKHAVFFRIIALTSLGLLFITNSYSQWVQTQGPRGITVTRFFDDGTWLFAGTQSKGAYRSSDNGDSWTPANGSMENSSVFSFAEDSSYLYAGTDSGVFRSSDDGLTWEHANTGIQTFFANCLLVADGYLFMGGIGSGVYRSADHGDTWTDANGGALGSSYILAMCFAGGKLIVEADNYVFYSTDHGDSWFLDTGPTQFYTINRFYTSGDTVMACTGGTFFPSATFFVSYDAINTWNGPITVATDVSLSGIARDGNDFYVGSANGVYRSTDFGLNWNHVAQTGLRFGNRLQNDFTRSGSNFLLSYDEIGIYASQDGAVWIESKNGFPPASSIDNCMITVGNDLWTGTHSDGVYMTSDQGDSWTHVAASNITEDTLPNAIIFSMLDAGNNVLLAGACGYGLYRSTDYGASWTHITDGFNVGYADFMCIFSLGKSGNNLLAGTNTGMYYSTDNGLSWNQSSLSNSEYQVEGIAVHGDVVCVGVTPQNPYVNGGIYRSTDNGENFTLTSTVPVDVVAMEADAAGNFYAGSLFDFYRSTDNGVNWNGAGIGLPVNSGGFSIKVAGADVFVGNIAGLFYSEDNGATFIDASDGLDAYPNNAVQGLAADATYLYAGMFRDAVWKRPLSEFGVATEVNDDHVQGENHLVITGLSPEVISFQIHLAQDAPVELNLIDELGTVRKNLPGENLTRGIHSGTIDVHDLSPGIYFLEMKGKDFEITVKCVKM